MHSLSSLYAAIGFTTLAWVIFREHRRKDIVTWFVLVTIGGFAAALYVRYLSENGIAIPHELFVVIRVFSGTTAFAGASFLRLYARRIEGSKT